MWGYPRLLYMVEGADETCDVAAWIPGTRRSGGRELSYITNEPTKLYRFLMSCTVAERYGRDL